MRAARACVFVSIGPGDTVVEGGGKGGGERGGGETQTTPSNECLEPSPVQRLLTTITPFFNAFEADVRFFPLSWRGRERVIAREVGRDGETRRNIRGTEAPIWSHSWWSSLSHAMSQA